MSNTNELTVDVRGSLCPKPVIETKKVSDANPGAIITTIVDNEVSRDNVAKFGKSRGYGVEVRQNGKDFYLTLTPNANSVTEVSCEPLNYGNRVVLMTKDYLGEGSEELGRNLMKTFWVCMLEADVKPLVFGAGRRGSDTEYVSPLSFTSMSLPDRSIYCWRM